MKRALAILVCVAAALSARALILTGPFVGGGGVTPGSTNGIWGAISGSIGDQTDLQAQFGTKLNATNGSGTNFTLNGSLSGTDQNGQGWILTGTTVAGNYYTVTTNFINISSGAGYVQLEPNYLQGYQTTNNYVLSGTSAHGENISNSWKILSTGLIFTNTTGNITGTVNGLKFMLVTNGDMLATTNGVNASISAATNNLSAYQKTNASLDKIIIGTLSGFTNLSASGVTFTGSKRLLGRNTGTLGGTGEELDLSTVLDWTTNATGSILYRGSSGWTYLLPGSEGTLLLAHGAAAPTWGNSISNLNIGTQTVTNSYGLTNVWSGPTNSLALNGGEYDYTMTAATAVTNFSSILSSAICRGTLWLKNTSGGNLTFNVPASVVTADGLRTWTVTNGQFGVVTFDMKPSVRTNAAFVNQF